MLNITRFILTALIFLWAAGCATAYRPIPEDYYGPMATVNDSGAVESGSKGQLYVLAAIDGNAIKTSLDATRDKSHNKGFNLTVVVGRRVQAKPMKVKLVATHTTEAPIHEFASRVAGTFFSVEGEVEFNPSADGTYVVRGDLKKEGSSVWIEDAQTHERVAEVVAQTK